MKQFDFQDRVSTYPGRKRLKIINQTADTMLVDVEMADEPTNTGTAIDQEVMREFQQGIVDANNTAARAETMATSANTKSDSAVTTATNANTKADNAVVTANSANVTAGQANTTAGEANTKSDNAVATATNANTTSAQANATAMEAKTIAEEAKTIATNANNVSASANTKAESAVTTATNANTTSTQANTTSAEAKTIAEEAKTIAETSRTTSEETKAAVEELAQQVVAQQGTKVKVDGVYTPEFDANTKADKSTFESTVQSLNAKDQELNTNIINVSNRVAVLEGKPIITNVSATYDSNTGTYTFEF